MQSRFIVSTDKEEKVKLESSIQQAAWKVPAAYGGFEASFEVKTHYVAEGASVEIQGRSSKGKAPGTVNGKIFNNCFRGKILIPENVSPDAEIWFEAKLPKHGLTMESETIPARPPIMVSKLGWDRTEVARGDIVTLTCQFESGVVEGEEVFFIIYEHNPDSCDMKLTSIPAYVEGNRVEVQWEFRYENTTAAIPTELEKNAISKRYINPQYYFIMSVNGIRAGEKRESGLLTFRDRLKLQMLNSYGVVMKNEKYKVRFADGTTKDYTTDGSGIISDDSIPPGKVVVEYIRE